MTIQATASRASFLTDGTSKNFPVPIQSYLATDFTVTLTAANGLETTLVLNSDYSLAVNSGDAPPKWQLTTLAGTAYPAGETLQIFLNPPVNQLTQYVPNQSFPSLAVQQNFDRLTQMVQRLQDQLARTLRAPDGDINVANWLMVAASQRANLQLLFDANGNPTVGAAIAGTLTSALIGVTANSMKQTAAEVSAGVSVVDGTYPPGWPQRYGGSLASTDNTAAFQAALNCCPFGQSVVVPPGTWKIASVVSTGNDEHSLTVLNGTVIQGFGEAVSQIQLTGTNSGDLFYGKNVTGFSLTDVYCFGNNQPGTILGGSYGKNQAVVLVADNTATQTLGNYRISRNRFGNFGGAYWIYCYNNSATYDMADGQILQNTFDSYAGNCVDQETQYSADCIALQGSGVSTNVVRDFEVAGNVCNGNYIKRFCTLWGSTIRIRRHHNVCVSMGGSNQFDDTPNDWSGAVTYPVGYLVTVNGTTYTCILQHTNQVPPNATYWTASQGLTTWSPKKTYPIGYQVTLGGTTYTASSINTNSQPPSANWTTGGATALTSAYGGSSVYAFLSYKQAAQYPPDEIVDESNIIDGVLDCGFYFASCARVTIARNQVSGQLSALDGTIYKGAIAGESGNGRFTISDNTLDNNVRNVAWAGVAPSAQLFCGTNHITNMPAGSSGYRIGTTAAQPWNSATFYTPGYLVSSGGNLYSCIAANTNQIPPNATYWVLVASLQWDKVEIMGGEITGWASTGTLGVTWEATTTSGGRIFKCADIIIEVQREGIAINHTDAGADILSQDVSISENTILTGALTGVDLGVTATPYVTIRNNNFGQGKAFSNVARHISAPTPSNLDISGNTYSNFTSGAGACVYCPNPVTRFTMAGNRYKNVAAANMADTSAVNNPGFTLPNWGANQADFVQALQPQVSGTGGFGTVNQHKYTDGWMYDGTTWNPHVILTGT